MTEPLDVVRLTRELIDIPSLSGDEGAVGSYLDTLLSQRGFETKRHEIEAGRFNVFASAGGRPRVIFCSHIDTVPPFIASSEDDELVYGRGACDAKGNVAAMIAAGDELRRRGIADFAFLFVIAEETDSVGAKRANVEFAGLDSEFVIVGEPTESKFVRASKGAMTCFLRFDGVAAHSAYPERGASAITKLVEACREISATEWGSDPVLGRGTANIGVVRGGDKANIIPSWAEADLIFRTVEAPDRVLERLRGIVERHGGRIERWWGNEPMLMAVPEGAEGTVVAFNTDVPHLRALGRPLLFGPGSILDAHTAGEKVAKRDLRNAVGTHVDLVRDLLAGKVR